MWLNSLSDAARLFWEVQAGSYSALLVVGCSVEPRRGKAACRFRLRIQAARPTGIPVPAGRTSWALFRSREAGMATLERLMGWHLNRMAQREIRLDRGSGLLPAHSEARPETHFARLTSSSRTCQSQKTSH